MNDSLSSFFNAARWLSAFAVLVYHARNFLIVGYGSVVHKSIILRFFYFITGFGHEAVMIFFVISGYLVGGLSYTRPREHGFDVQRYAVNRISRIYVVLVPALILGGVLDHIGITWFNQSAIYNSAAGKPIASLQFNVGDNLGLGALLGNLAMLETLDHRIVPIFGSNGPLWSLAYEWWYYVLFAMAMMAKVTRRPLVRIAALVAFALMVALLPTAMIAWSAMWLVGMAACIWCASGRAVILPPWLGVGLCLSALMASRFSHGAASAQVSTSLTDFALDLTVALGFAAAIVAFHRRTAPLPGHQVHHALAELSYSVYLFHFPALLFLAAFANHAFGLSFIAPPSAVAVVSLATVCGLVLLWCWVLSRATEAHTYRVRLWLTDLLVR